MSTTLESDFTLCRDPMNNPDAYQCGDRYPHKNYAGPCARCSYIGQAASEDEQAKREVHALSLFKKKLMFSH
jgi:hypothetical protein